MKKFYSIIIPVKNQEKNISYNLDKLIKELNYFIFISKWEIILIDDGSTDMTSREISIYQKKIKNIKLIKNKLNKGKGYSVKKGINLLNKNSEKVVLIDSDIPYFKSLKLFFKTLNDNNLVIINRKDERSKLKIKEKNFYIFYRMLVGHMLNLFFRLSALTNLKDTQAGLKGFDSSLKKNFKKVKTNGFLFDLEFLLILKKKKIYPQLVPCTYSISGKSSIKFNFTIYFKIIRDLLFIIYNHITNKYE